MSKATALPFIANCFPKKVHFVEESQSAIKRSGARHCEELEFFGKLFAVQQSTTGRSRFTVFSERALNALIMVLFS